MQCGEVDCAVCKWAWPADSSYSNPWDTDPLRGCRCEVENQNDVVTEYTYGGMLSICTNLTDGECSDTADCGICKWSWPLGSDGSDPLAECRCEYTQDETPPPPDANTVIYYGGDCNNLDDGFCGDVDCAACKWSWPADTTFADPWKNDPYRECRCELENSPDDNNLPDPIDEVVYKYTNECTRSSHDKSLCTNDCPCFKSWPIDDPNKWKSVDAACRCLPKQRAPEGYKYN